MQVVCGELRIQKTAMEITILALCCMALVMTSVTTGKNLDLNESMNISLILH